MKPDVTPHNIGLLDQHIATKRSVLSIINSFYDPSGMVLAYLMKFRLFMREVATLSLDWDPPLPSLMQETCGDSLENW